MDPSALLPAPPPTDGTTPARLPTHVDDGTIGRRLTWGALVLFALLRALVVAVATVPKVTPDEVGSWAIARFLTGGHPAILMQDMPRYSLVPGAVLAPLAALPLGPVARYRLALVLLSGLTVVAAVLVRSAVSRLDLGGPLAPPLAFAVTLLFPATLATGAFTWAEPTVLLCLALLVWATVRTFADRSSAALFIGSVAAGLAPSTHGRLVAVPLVWIAALLVDAWWCRREPDRLRPRTTAASIGTTVAVAAIGVALSAAVTAALWTAPTDSVPTGLLGSLGNLGWWGAVITEGAGELWYLLTSSAGLALVGAAVLVRAALRSARRDRRLVAGTLLALLGSVPVISTLTIASSLHAAGFAQVRDIAAPRWDHLVYGRYEDAVVLLLTAIGAAGLLALARRHGALRFQLAAAVLAIGCAALIAARAAGLELSPALDVNIAGVAILPGDATRLHLARWTAWGVLLMVVLGILARAGRRPIAVGCAALLVAGSIAATGVSIGFHRGYTAEPMYAGVGPAPAGAPVAMVARDAALDPSVRLSVFVQEAVLAPQGWRFDFSPSPSSAVAAEPGPRTSLLLLVRGDRPDGPGWRMASSFSGVAMWLRR
jgi:hypothetical protein